MQAALFLISFFLNFIKLTRTFQMPYRFVLKTRSKTLSNSLTITTFSKCSPCSNSLQGFIKNDHEKNISQYKVMSNEEIEEASVNHYNKLKLLLYPAGQTLTHSRHLVHDHPIYNFLHRYYRYSKEDLRRYSPGMYVYLKDFQKANPLIKDRVSNKLLIFDDLGGAYFSKNNLEEKLKASTLVFLMRNFELLKATSKRSPFFGCFGMHEWAMLYSGNQNGSKPYNCYQKQLKTRVNQDTIDSVVRSSGLLKCTHFDAWRFFHPDAQSINSFQKITRDDQLELEQPGCVHANMDLFRFAFHIYPLISSDLLLKVLEIALWARKIDLRASPYDVSMYLGCEEPLLVETSEGRKKYIKEQEKLATEAFPIRKELLDIYMNVLTPE